MHLILLPGLDGTGEMYSSFIRGLAEDIQTTIISYPPKTDLDYTKLVDYVRCRLPKNEKYIILAESFSGPIGYQLAKQSLPNMLAVIFVATFIRNPNRFLMSLVRLLPLSLILRLPIPDFVVRYWLLGTDATDSMVAQFKSVLHSLPVELVKFRFNLIRKLIMDNGMITLPVTYIQAKRDSLVLDTNYLYFQSRCSRLSHVVVDGPHFLLQSRPKECANIVMEQLGKLAGGDEQLSEN